MSGTKKASGNRGQSGAGSSERKKKDGSGTVGRALRTVYDNTLREEVPEDFLDLLRKLD
ncbi:MAG TPA: NepR family anti-sigma factor [Sphingomicrobium sp.]|nr:NepR family anti-sigma factor [Sphingomicrobium sp.]